jgi:hypothetical protein
VGSALSSKDRGAARNANNAAADATTLQAEIAADQYDRYKEIYDPLERRIVSEAQDYDTPDRYAREIGSATQAVQSEFGKAAERLGRTPGLDPSSPAFFAAKTQLGLDEAANVAVAQNTARNRVTDTAYARKFDALGLGKGLPASSSSMLSSAASGLRSQANFSMDQANNTAGAVGRVTDRIFNSPGVNNWLTNTFSSNTAPAGFGTNQDAGVSYGLDNFA